jgi:phosphoribosylformylglycinamidine synthase
VIRPGGDAALVRLPDTAKGLALTTDCTPRYCQADPKAGGAQAVAESWRNLTAIGARPLAVTDNMNFGNPQRPEIMGQFAGCVEGIREACLALGYPVVSGNVSFYNETNGKGILPTPVIGGVGVIEDVAKAVTIAFKAPGEAILLIGETAGHLGSSLWLREIHGREDGPPPAVDLVAERRNGDFVRARIAAGELTACHDIADGGLLVALAEMAMAGKLGAEIALPGDTPAQGFCFGEDQARYLVTLPAPKADGLLAAARRASVPARLLGRTGGNALTLAGRGTISLTRLIAAHETFLPRLMGA